jgi:hypothetical protein
MVFQAHIEIIKLIVAYTLVGAFIFTTVITLLSMVRIVRFVDPSQERQLFKVLILELAVGCVTFFLGILNFNPVVAQDKIEAPIVRDKDGLSASLESQKDHINALEDLLAAAKSNDRVGQRIEKLEESAFDKEAKANIRWAVLKDAHRNTKYHRYKQQMSKFDAVIAAQSHNKHAQTIIRKFGPEKTLAYLRELGE